MLKFGNHYKVLIAQETGLLSATLDRPTVKERRMLAAVSSKPINVRLLF